MEATAITRYLRISPRKMRLVIDAVRRKSVSDALALLANLKKKGAKLAAKTVKSAAANAKVKKMDENNLYIREIKADGGPSLKRYMARSMGRADVILKRMTHLTVIVAEREVKHTPQPVAGKKDKQTLAAKPEERRKKSKSMSGSAR
jgi:large subunit ribosomal protein L22